MLEPVNAHQGSMLFDEARQRYYWYGNHHRDCPATTRCHCVGDNESAWTVTSGIAIYSSADLMEWTMEAGPVLAPHNQPRAIGPINGEYRIYLQFPLRLAVSGSPAGPFVLRPGVVKMCADAPCFPGRTVHSDATCTPQGVPDSRYRRDAR